MHIPPFFVFMNRALEIKANAELKLAIVARIESKRRRTGDENARSGKVRRLR